MLKKAGIVVLTTAAGVLSLSSVAFAGEMPSSDDGRQGSHESHHSHECGNKYAFSGGGNLVDASNLAANPDISHVNVLASDNSVDHGCRGGHGGNKAAFSGGGNLVDASNLLSNADVSHLNVLAADNSQTG